MIHGRFTGRFTLRGLGCLWVLLATAVAAGVLIGGLLLGALSPTAASRSAAHPADLPFPSGRMTTERACPLPSPDVDGLRTGAPHDPASVSAAASGDARPAGAPPPSATGMRPAPTGEPRTAASLRGIASFVGPGYGARYLALPSGRGHTVRICGPAACVVRTSTDSGPDLAMQRAGRVADLSFHDFGVVCGCDPWVLGLLRVSVTPVQPERSTP